MASILNVPYEYIFFFNDTATTEIYPLSLHDALPISFRVTRLPEWPTTLRYSGRRICLIRSEEHTSELQSLTNLVCRLLFEKKSDTVQVSQNALTVRGVARRGAGAGYS